MGRIRKPRPVPESKWSHHPACDAQEEEEEGVTNSFQQPNQPTVFPASPPAIEIEEDDCIVLGAQKVHGTGAHSQFRRSRSPVI
jgi:hypothetical protein